MDGLEFYLDGQMKMPIVSYTNTYTTRKFEDIEKGFHKAEWRYVKNEIMAKGKDRAQINVRSIFCI
jgi:hypothetical protein